MTEVNAAIPRLVEADENTQLYTATHATLSLPSPVSRVHSIAVMPGLGEHQRVIRAIEAWQESPSLEYLLVCGTNRDEVQQPQLTPEVLQEEPFNLLRTDNVLAQVTAAHTREQTDWIIEQVAAKEIGSLALFVSHWHMPRAYRTVLKSMLNANIIIPVFPVVIGTSPKAIIPEYNKTVESLSAGEVHRINKYQQNAQIANYEETMSYLEWLWAQDVVPID